MPTAQARVRRPHGLSAPPPSAPSLRLLPALVTMARPSSFTTWVSPVEVCTISSPVLSPAACGALNTTDSAHDAPAASGCGTLQPPAALFTTWNGPLVPMLDTVSTSPPVFRRLTVCAVDCRPLP